MVTVKSHNDFWRPLVEKGVVWLNRNHFCKVRTHFYHDAIKHERFCDRGVVESCLHVPSVPSPRFDSFLADTLRYATPWSFAWRARRRGSPSFSSGPWLWLLWRLGLSTTTITQQYRLKYRQYLWVLKSRTFPQQNRKRRCTQWKKEAGRRVKVLRQGRGGWFTKKTAPGRAKKLAKFVLPLSEAPGDLLQSDATLSQMKRQKTYKEIFHQKHLVVWHQKHKASKLDIFLQKSVKAYNSFCGNVFKFHNVFKMSSCDTFQGIIPLNRKCEAFPQEVQAFP